MTVRKNFFLMALAAALCCNAAHAYGPVTLSPTWSEWDPSNLGSGVQTLSGESSSGYTSSISGAVGETSEVPQVYQIFAPQKLNKAGDKVEMKFDIQVHTIMGASINLDTDFRYALSSTDKNSGGYAALDAGGNAGGTSVRMRMDKNGITWVGDPTDPTTWTGASWPNAFDENNMNHSLNASGTVGQAGGTPSGVNLGDSVTEIHSVQLSFEREVGGGIAGAMEWTSDAPGAAVISASFTDFDDSYPNMPLHRMREVDMINLAFLEEVVSETYPFSYTVSNVEVWGTAVPEPTSLLLAIGSCVCAAAGRRRVR